FPGWAEISVDLGLRNFIISRSYPRPSQINLNINGTLVSDKGWSTSSYLGEWINNSKLIPNPSGSIFLNVTSNFSSGIEFHVVNTMSLLNETTSIATFLARWNDPIVNWNITLRNITYPDLKDALSYLSFVNISLPTTWNVSHVLNETDTPTPILWNNYTLNHRKLLYFRSSNGSFRVNATDLNHLNVINDFNITDNLTHASYYMNDTLLINYTYGITELGNATLFVYSPSNVSLQSYRKLTQDNYTEHAWKINNDSNEEGVHHLKVLIKTLMEVGLNFTDINCLRVPTNLTLMTNTSLSVSPGTPVKISVFYNDTLHDDPINNASLLSNWSSLYGGYSWQPFGPASGYYNITFYTDSAVPGVHVVSVQLFKSGFENGTLDIQITIEGAIATYTNLVAYYETRLHQGIQKNFSNPDPYPNDEKPIRVEYRELSSGVGITGALVTAIPDWSINQFSSIGVGDGIYEISIDTTDLAAFDNESDIHYVNYTISKTGFDTIASSFWINVTRINETYLYIDTTGFDNLECYQGEQVDLACGFTDLYHGSPILFDETNPGNISWMIYNESNPGQYLIEPTLMERSIWEYQSIVDVKSHELSAGYYNVTIKTNAEKDYVNFSKNISLHVKDNLNTTLSISYQSTPESELRVGCEITVQAHLTIENQSNPQGSQIYNASNFDIKFMYKNQTYNEKTNMNGIAIFTVTLTEYDYLNNLTINVTYDGNSQIDPVFNDSILNLSVLPKHEVTMTISVSPSEILVGSSIQVIIGLFYEDTGLPISNMTIKVILTFNLATLEPIIEYGITDETGVARIGIMIPDRVGTADYLEVQGIFDGGDIISSGHTSLSSKIRVLTPLKILFENLWWILLIIGGGVAAIIGYHRGVRVPRRRKFIEKQKKIASAIVDSQNLVHLIIILKEAGQSIYSQTIGDVKLNPDLISGFLTAIAAFQSEVKLKMSRAKEQQGFELNYADFKVLLMDGFYVNVALILNDRPSNELRHSLSLFITKFEQKYYANLKDWDGSLKVFRNASELVEKVFDISYQHSFTIGKYSIRNLNPLEQVLTLIAENINDQQGYFYLSDVIKRTEQTRPEPKYEILYYLNELIKKQVFKKQDKEVIETLKKERASLAEKADEEKSIFDLTNLTCDDFGEKKMEVHDKDEFIKKCGLSGISDEDFEGILNETLHMSKASTMNFLNEIINSGSTSQERLKHVTKDLLKNREKLRRNLDKSIEKAEKLITKNKFLESYEILKEIKQMFEELGEDENATKISYQIAKILENFDSKEIVKILRINASELIKMAEKRIAIQDMIQGTILYRKAARIYLEMGDREEAVKFFDLAKHAEGTNL
ncbi:MAG: hypothetical protein ACTSVY_02025, partial [Candidatus Helarchaeota archaeon]